MIRPLGDYFRISERPLTCLLFVAPLILFCEVGTIYFASDPVARTETRVRAFEMMRRLFEVFGATGRYLPAFAVVSILLGCHFTRKDPWRLEPGVTLGMYLESMLLGVPPIILNALLREFVPLAGVDHGWKGDLVIYVGAGVYEELVFRLIAFVLLSIVLADLLKLRPGLAALLMVAISSILFSLYHYLGTEPFAWSTFVFRSLAGAYFAAVFLSRGFGITVGSHAAYDVLVGIIMPMARAG